MMGRVWRFKAWRDGGDVCGQGMGTRWDDQITASGLPADLPGLVACSLPTGRDPATAGSPFPAMPWGTIVKVWCGRTGRVVYAPLIDEGPGFSAEAGTGHQGSAMIDLTPAAWRVLGPSDNCEVTIRIAGGQLYPGDIMHALRAQYAAELV